MHERDAQAIAREFRRADKRFDDMERRLATIFLSGKVADINGDKIRIEFEPENPKTGKPFLSPWVQVSEAAGQSGTHFPVKKGDPMGLISRNGELGPGSIAIRNGYTDDAANPTDKKQQELVIANDGPVRIKGSSITFEASGTVEAKAADLKHDGVSVGKNHHHKKVMAGEDESGDPVS